MKRMIALLLTLLLLLTGCTPQATEEEGLRLWFAADAKEWTADAKALDHCPYGGAETVPALVAALLEGPPENSGLRSPIPEGTELLDWSVRYGVLSIDLSRNYNDLVGVDMTLADYCLTLTLTQLKGVNGLRITVNGQPPAFRDRQIFYAGDVVFSGAEDEPVELTVNLFFGQADGSLAEERRVFLLTESEQPAQAALEALVAGPRTEGLYPVIPQGVEIRSAYVADGVCYADFSAALMTTVPADEGDQIRILSSVVETLCGLETVTTVQILVEGETVSHYGQVDVSQPLEPSVGRS